MIDYLFLYFVLTQFLDYYSTSKVLSQGGIEVNPIINKLMKLYGVKNTLIFKGFFISILFYIFRADIGIIGFSIINIFYTIVLINNFKNIRR